MSWSYKIARVAGIDVYLHVTFFLILFFYGWLYYQAGGFFLAVYGVIFTMLLFFCVLLHEFGHAFAARAFGIRTPDITLLPIGGVARLERMPRNPWQEFVIAIAGPAVNVGIAIILYFMLGHSSPLDDFTILGHAGGGLLEKLLQINVLLVVFNLIPAFPMDGGRVLRALLATQMKHAKATLVAARVGQGIAVLFCLAAFFRESNPMLFFIAVFVFLGAQQELSYAQLREAAIGLRVGQAMMTRFETIPDELQVGQVASFLLGSSQESFPVVDSSLHVKGLVSREDLLRAAKEFPATTPISSLARKVPNVVPDMDFESAFDTMTSSMEPVLPVVNSSGQIVGLVTLAHLAELSRLHRND